MIHPFLTNQTLERLIKMVSMDEKIRKEFLDLLPSMDKEDRIRLLDTLKNVILLQKEKEAVVKRIKKEENKTKEKEKAVGNVKKAEEAKKVRRAVKKTKKTRKARKRK